MSPDRSLNGSALWNTLELCASVMCMNCVPHSSSIRACSSSEATSCESVSVAPVRSRFAGGVVV